MSLASIPSTTLAETILCGRQPSAPRRIWTRAIAGVLGVSILFGSAAPGFARDKNDDLAKALAAAIVLGLIVNQIDNKNDRDRDHPRPVPYPTPRPDHSRHPRVPEVCAIEVDGARNSVAIYPESCLRRQGFDYRLPRDCAKTARVYGRSDRVYGVQCLRSAGFRVSGR